MYEATLTHAMVTIPMTVRVEGVDGSPFEGVKVYAFDGTTYKGYSGTSGKDGQVTFTLPQGNYRFRGDLNGTQFWSSTENACNLPGCANAVITLPGGNTSRSAVTVNYTYDGLSRLTAADYSNGDYYHYAYDAVGNRLTETTAKGETAYTYDPANRLTSVNGQAVQWDDNGNMLADGQAVYSYNTANKLVGVTKGTSSIVYAYSGLGDRLKQIADGVTTDYTLDINAGLTQVLQDNTNKYIYGNARISQIAETQTGYFLPDALGSMRQMTDASADLTLAREYDPYGNVVSSSGAGETVYGYTGEMQSGGLVHLRARDYASLLGRFTSRDTWEGDSQKPISLNQWIYVYDNSINITDPNGNEPKDFPPVSVNVYLSSSIPRYRFNPPAQYYPSNEPKYFDLCGHIALEMIYGTATHSQNSLQSFIDADVRDDNKGGATAVGDLQVLAQAVFPDYWVKKAYAGKTISILRSGSYLYATDSTPTHNWFTTNLNQDIMYEIMYKSLQKGHYIAALVTLDKSQARITSHDLSPLNDTDPNYVAHWVVVTGLYGGFVAMNNPYFNGIEMLNWSEFNLSVKKSGMSMFEIYPDDPDDPYNDERDLISEDRELGICP